MCKGKNILQHEKTKEHRFHRTSTVSGTIIGHTANTVTLQTGDGATITCFTEGAKDTSTSNMESGAGICITFDPTKSKNSNIYTSIKIQDA